MLDRRSESFVLTPDRGASLYIEAVLRGALLVIGRIIFFFLLPEESDMWDSGDCSICFFHVFFCHQKGLVFYSC